MNEDKNLLNDVKTSVKMIVINYGSIQNCTSNVLFIPVSVKKSRRIL